MKAQPVPFIERICELKVRSFQREFLEELFREEKGRRVYTSALWGLPRGNGKSHIAAAIALKMLVADGREFGEVIIAAGSRDQASIAFESAKRLTSGPLQKHIHVLPGRKVMRHDSTGSTLRIVSAEGPLQHGLRPTCVIFDEVWNQPNRELWEALVGGLVKVPDPLLLCISTAGYDRESLLFELCQRGERRDDPRFLYRWHGLPENSDLDYREPATWKLANPAMSCEDPFLSEEGLRDSVSRMHEAEFRRWHLNQWTQSKERWLPPDAWEALDKAKVADGERVILAFAGTYDNDSAALVGIAGDRVFVIGAWEGDDEYMVPRASVDAAVADAMQRFKVTRFVCDPLGWQSEMQTWSERYGQRVVGKFDWQHDIRSKAAACDKFYAAVLEKKLRSDGDPRLARHLEAVRVKEHREGAYIGRGSRNGPPVGLAVAAVMAFDSAGERVRKSAYSDAGLLVV